MDFAWDVTMCLLGVWVSICLAAAQRTEMFGCKFLTTLTTDITKYIKAIGIPHEVSKRRNRDRSASLDEHVTEA